MDKILRFWVEDLSMEIGTFLWWYSTHLMGKYPSVEYTYLSMEIPPYPWISIKPLENENILHFEIWTPHVDAGTWGRRFSAFSRLLISSYSEDLSYLKTL